MLVWLKILTQSLIACALILTIKKDSFLFIPSKLIAIALLGYSLNQVHRLKEIYSQEELKEDTLATLREVQVEEQLQHLQQAAEFHRLNEQKDKEVDRELQKLQNFAPLLSELLKITGRNGAFERMALGMLQSGSTIGEVLQATAEMELQIEQVRLNSSKEELPNILPPKVNNDWIKGFLSSTCLVWGNQGSGKSWFVRYLAQEKVKSGYKLVVFDPNSNRYEWQGVELINDYAEIEEKMSWYVKELMTRYKEFGQTTISEEEWRSRLWAEGKAYSFICEEMTTYADFIQDKDLLIEFVKVATSLSRKQEMPVVFVAHNNTQSCLGNVQGLGNLIGRMQQIELLATTDPTNNQPIASNEALIKLDGSKDWVKVKTPFISEKIRVFGESLSKLNYANN